MADPARRPPARQQPHPPQIDDPDVFLSLGPHPHHDTPHQDPEHDHEGRSDSLSDEDYVPQPIEEDDDNKNEDPDAYEAESLNLQDEEQEKSVTNRSRREPTDRPLVELQPRSSAANDEKSNKSAPKSRKRTKKKVVESQDDDQYSGEYVSRKKGRPREVKKGNKRGEVTRSRGKPRGKGSNAARLGEIKKEYIYSDEVPQKNQRLRSSRRAQPVPQQPNYIMAPFSTSWRVAEENQQDWESQDASIWSESVNKREEYASEIMSLIESKPENIVSLIANLPPLLYHTFH